MNCYHKIFTRTIACIRHFLSSSDFLNSFRVKNRFVRKQKFSLRQVVFYLLQCHASKHFQDLPGIGFPNQDSKQTSPIPIRVIRVVLHSGVTEYMTTNLMNPDITPEMFKELCFLRWKTESKYNELKKPLGIEEFSGATPVSVEQEFYINSPILISVQSSRTMPARK